MVALAGPLSGHRATAGAGHAGRPLHPPTQVLIVVQIASRPGHATTSCGGTLSAKYGTRRCIRCTCNWTTVLLVRSGGRVVWLCLSPSGLRPPGDPVELRRQASMHAASTDAVHLCHSRCVAHTSDPCKGVKHNLSTSTRGTVYTGNSKEKA
jgi:hypothetical protein